jgi:uncharacterized lipoprotein
MKKIIVAATLMLLAACSAPQQQQLNLALKPTMSSGDIVKSTPFALMSKDLRTAQYVALVDSGRENIQPIHAKQNVRLTIENVLAKQFESQGFEINSHSENTLTLDILDALVSVQHSMMKNNIDAVVKLQITAETPSGKLVQTYNGTAKRTGALSASNEDIEAVLNDVINLVLKQVAEDAKLQNYMKEQF